MPVAFVVASSRSFWQLLWLPGDTEFVEAAYLRLLFHKPDQRSLRVYRFLLRRGLSRLELLWRLALSYEGRLHGARLAGLWLCTGLCGPLVFVRSRQLSFLLQRLIRYGILGRLFRIVWFNPSKRTENLSTGNFG